MLTQVLIQRFGEWGGGRKGGGGGGGSGVTEAKAGVRPSNISSKN